MAQCGRSSRPNSCSCRRVAPATITACSAPRLLATRTLTCAVPRPHAASPSASSTCYRQWRARSRSSIYYLSSPWCRPAIVCSAAHPCHEPTAHQLHAYATRTRARRPLLMRGEPAHGRRASPSPPQQRLALLGSSSSSSSTLDASLQAWSAVVRWRPTRPRVLTVSPGSSAHI